MSRSEFSKLTDYMKERVEYLKSSRSHLTIEFVKNYCTYGPMYLNQLKKKVEQIVKKTATYRTNASTARNADTLENNMKRVLESLDKANNEFNIIERNFLAPKDQLANSRHSIQSR